MPDSNAAIELRFADPLKFMPVVFVWCNIIILWTIYTVLHCIPMLADPGQSVLGHLFAQEPAGNYTWAITEMTLFNLVTLLVVICFIRCILTHPGTIPGKETGNASWEYVHGAFVGDAAASLGLGLQETKRSGDRRHCKWCAKYKPDRCHHCRVCRQCILKMDHHCPWIYNCVGFANHKYFFLLLLYSTIATNMIVWTMLVNFNKFNDAHTSVAMLFCLIFGETLAAFLGLVVTVFFGFHVWLMLKGMTTIEFCEKNMKGQDYDSSLYHRGCCGNVQAVLGDNPFFWLLPCSPPSGDGLTYVSEVSPIAPLMAPAGRAFEAGRGVNQQKLKKKRKEAGTGEYPSSDASLPISVASVAALKAPRTPYGSDEVLFCQSAS